MSCHLPWELNPDYQEANLLKLGSRCLVALCLVSLPLAAAPLPREGEGPRAGERGVYVVQLQELPLARSPRAVRVAASRTGRPPRLDLDALDSRRELDRLWSGQEAALAAIGDSLGRPAEPRARYSVAFNGFALEMTAEEAERLATLPGIARVRPSSRLKIASDAGPAWSGAPGLWDGTATGAPVITQGEGIVIGVIDTGIDLTHPSFADIGGEGYNHANPRGSGNYVGWCNPSHPSYSASLPCNDKLIGVWSWPDAGDDPRDDNGHGTHTASIAAGNHVVASLAGVVRTISGVAPHANLIAYDVCDDDGYCYDYVLIEAVEQAVVDGVDVISVAISDYGYSPWGDSLAEALLSARASGIFAAAALNEYYGSPGSPANAPWVLGVAATTHHRRFTSKLAGLSGGINPPGDLQGTGLTASYGPAAIVYAGSFGDYDCSSPFPPGTFGGKIVVCDFDGWYTERTIGQNVLAGGAGGLILVSYYYYSPPGDPVANVLPSLRLSAEDGYDLVDWLYRDSGAHTGRIVATTVEESAAYGDRLWPWSPAGASYLADLDNYLKPDVAAPGEGILAAHTDPGRFRILSGTSMAAAHAAGAAALLTDLHPEWTPTELQSALQMTGVPVTRQDGSAGTVPAGPLQVGGGRIDLRAVARVGLVLDETVQSFAAASPYIGGDPSTLNLPALVQSHCILSCGWTRRVRSTRAVPTQWTVSVEAPAGVVLTVQPSSFTLAPGATQTLQITATGSTSTEGAKEGRVILTETGGQAPTLRLPLATWWAPHFALTVQKSGPGAGRVTSSPGGIDCGADCSELYPEDSRVILTAAPEPGSVFVGWDDACYGVESTCEVDLYYRSVTATAHFALPSPDRRLDNHVPVKGSLEGPVSEGTWNYYFLDVEPGMTELVVDLFDLDAEANLYLRFGSKPTVDYANCYDYDYYGTLNRRCVVTQPTAGRWWVGVNNYDEDVEIQYSIRASWGVTQDRELANRSPLDGFLVASVRGGSWKYYFIDVEPGSSDLQVALANLSADADLYLRHEAKPDRSNHSCSSTNASTLPDVCTVTDPAPGRWWIGINNFSTGTINYTLRAGWRTTDVATDLYTVSPCRLFDSRSGQPLSSGGIRNIPVTGICGIPPTARAVSVIVTVVSPTGIGRVVLYPGDEGQPSTSTLNFQTGQNKANNALMKLGGGALAAWAAVSGNGQVHLVVDVNGYFE